MKFQEESYLEVCEDIKPLIQLHWEQIALNKDKIKLNPDWDEYERLYNAGNLKIYTARAGHELVGYFIVGVANNIHYKDHLFANCDIIYVKPDSRAGMTGYKLISYAEKELKKIGVSVLNINTKTHTPFDKLLVRMNFGLIERLYSKFIG
jgi:GNAT superfamily N-acetyltransferase